MHCSKVDVDGMLLSADAYSDEIEKDNDIDKCLDSPDHVADTGDVAASVLSSDLTVTDNTRKVQKLKVVCIDTRTKAVTVLSIQERERCAWTVGAQNGQRSH